MREPERLQGPVDAIRLTIRYGGDRYEVVKRTRVRKVVPPSDPLLDDEEEQGFWAEVRRGGESLYRQRLVGAIQRDVEVFTTDQERPISRLPIEDPVGTFTIVVPVLDADEVAIVGPPTPTRGRRRAPQAAPRVGDLATFAIDEPEGDRS